MASSHLHQFRQPSYTLNEDELRRGVTFSFSLSAPPQQRPREDTHAHTHTAPFCLEENTMSAVMSFTANVRGTPVVNGKALSFPLSRALDGSC